MTLIEIIYELQSSGHEVEYRKKTRWRIYYNGN